jgi:hypothetical protein
MRISDMLGFVRHRLNGSSVEELDNQIEEVLIGEETYGDTYTLSFAMDIVVFAIMVSNNVLAMRVLMAIHNREKLSKLVYDWYDVFVGAPTDDLHRELNMIQAKIEVVAVSDRSINEKIEWARRLLSYS